MQHSPFEIKSRLLRAVDREYNVVDMGTVLEIVTILERTPITKEALETTRLGRDINELRRKTKDESLAKRAKDLVRRWRDLILPQSEGGGGAPSQTDTSSQNGATLAPSSVIGVGARRQPGIPATSSTSGPGPGGGALRSTPISPATSLPASDKSSVSPALSTSRLDAVPRTHASNKRLRKEGDSSKSNSPELPPNKKSKSEELPPIQEINNQSTAVARLNGDHYDDSVGSDCEIVSVTPATPSTPTKQKSRKKAPKDRTKKKKDGGGSKSGGGDIVKEKIASIARLHKVKTTQELLAGLQSKSGDNCVFPSEDVALNKSEHIVKFLRSQTENDEDIVVDVEGRSDQEEDDAKKLKTGNSVSKTNKIAVKREKGTDKSKSSNQQGSTGTPSKSTVLQTPEEILSRLPPLDLDSIDWSDDVVLPDETTVPPSKAAAVTEADVDRVNQEHVPGVNGNFEEVDPGGERIFREWHELFTTMSNDQPLHILPYVVID